MLIKSIANRFMRSSSPSFSSEVIHGPMYTRIVEKLTRELKPIHLEVNDDSHKHAGHAAMKGTSA
jgi:BolA protein